eukprot:scaffold1798_cov76-Cylindrotheca_fusiformis.AAC.1
MAFQEQERDVLDKLQLLQTKNRPNDGSKPPLDICDPSRLFWNSSLEITNLQTGKPLSTFLFVDETPSASWIWLEQIDRYKLWNNGRAQIGWEHDQHFDFIATSPASTADKQQQQQQQQQLEVPNHPNMLTRHGRYVLKTTTTMVLILVVECNST